MTLLEIFEAEIQKLGGIRATYHFIKAENSKNISAVNDLKNYLRKRTGGDNKEWTVAEVRFIKDNINAEPKHLAPFLTKRTLAAIRQKKHKIKKAAN